MNYVRQAIARAVLLVVVPLHLAAEYVERVLNAATTGVTAWGFRQYDYPPLTWPDWRLSLALFTSALVAPFVDEPGPGVPPS